MSHYEQKLINGNLYWYRRENIGGRQTSTYVGVKLPPSAEQSLVDRAKFDNDRNLEVVRHEIEAKISKLQRQLKSL